jgi:hypothetical protein
MLEMPGLHFRQDFCVRSGLHASPAIAGGSVAIQILYIYSAVKCNQQQQLLNEQLHQTIHPLHLLCSFPGWFFNQDPCSLTRSRQISPRRFLFSCRGFLKLPVQEKACADLYITRIVWRADRILTAAMQ